MITKLEIQDEIDAAEFGFRECWDILKSMRTRPASRIFDFQPMLAEILHRLSTLYINISAERRDLIERKSLLNLSWFKKRQASLASAQLTVERAISVGRSLGDSFAWFFYQNDPDLLREHSGDQWQKILATGIGGRGEVEFIRGVRTIRGKMVLHHGITSILRIGDVSLIDLPQIAVAGIGELKTAEADGHLHMHLEFIIHKDLDTIDPWVFDPPSSDEYHFELSPEVQHSLNRQMRRLKKIVKRPVGPAQNIHAGDATHAQQLSHFIAQLNATRLSYEVLGPGLLIAGTRDSSRSLYRRLASSEKLPAGIDEGASYALQIVVPNSQYNRLVIMPIHYEASAQIHTLPGATPLFWWELPLEQVFDILFYRVRLLSIYNPAPLLEALISQGFEVVEETGHPYSIRLQKEVGDRIVRFDNVWYFMDLCAHFMFKSDHIARMMVEFIEIAESKVGVEGGKVDLIFNHRPFRPPANLTDMRDLTT